MAGTVCTVASLKIEATKSTSSSPNEVVVRALHTTQGAGLDVYAFFIKGGDIVRVADISRIAS